MMATQTARTASGLVPYRLTVRQFLQDDRRERLSRRRSGGAARGDSDLEDDQRRARFRRDAAGRTAPHQTAGGVVAARGEAGPVGPLLAPQPDISVLKANSRAFAHRWPQPADIALLVEVADTTYPKDTGIKLRRYAHVQVPQYWIVHLERRRVEVYRNPHGRHARALYRMLEFHPDDVEVPVVIDGHDLGRIAVKEILP